MSKNKPTKWRCPRHWSPAQRIARFIKVDPLSGCHIWQRSTKPNGYGQITYRCQRWMTAAATPITSISAATPTTWPR